MNNYILPVARKRNLVVQDLTEELLIYDLNRDKAICLNQSARMILEQCDGKTTLEDASQKLNVGREIISATLEKLKKNRLLDDTQPIPDIPKVSRRDLMRSGLALSIALPIVSTLVAPSALHAQSDNCVPLGQICSVTVVGENFFDMCCAPNTCTMQVNGFCCIVADIPNSCDPLNDFCCPGTTCDPQTLSCQ